MEAVICWERQWGGGRYEWICSVLCSGEVAVGEVMLVMEEGFV